MGPPKKLFSTMATCVLLAGCAFEPGSTFTPKVRMPGEAFPLPLPETTRHELATKGLPLMPAARRLACRQTARQSIPQVAADLGNVLVSDLCSVCAEMWAPPSELARYYRQMLNVKVLRLIEQGREDRDTVSALLHENIAKSMADFEPTRKAFVEARRQGRLPEGVKWDDPYYKEHGRYEHPAVELDRLKDVIYMSFYILANIDELKQIDLLAQWIRMEREYEDYCLDMDVWLIDSYFINYGVGADAAERHAELTGRNIVSGRIVDQSRWNAAWDIHDPLLSSNGIDTTTIQTVEVFEIPPEFPDSLDEETKKRIIRNFLDFAAQSQPAT
ncbi:MAG: hypothetical protein JSU94_17825 [Phycisphaerales bacterium]|nr:MAG: hypothetical protein JSU94_17825 [Phycisphaerales bacterium]